MSHNHNDESFTSHQALHAHWDCFGGASCSSMLGACMDLLSDQKVRDDIMEIINSITLNQWTISQSHEASMTATCVEMNQNVDESNNSTRYNLEQLDRMLTDPTHIAKEVREKTVKVFEELAIARNACFHDSNLPSTFQATTIAGVIAILLCLEKLHINTVSCGPLPLGEGSMPGESGELIPIPSPMTLQLLTGFPTSLGPENTESIDLMDPVAAAVMRVLTNASSAVGPTKRPALFATHKVGVGCDKSHRVLRLMVGNKVIGNDNNVHAKTSSFVAGETEMARSTSESILTDAPLWNIDRLTHLEANLDDMTAEALAFAIEILLENGAVDAWVAPIVMKKGRAAHTLHCLSTCSIEKKLLEIMFRHTSTLGVRIFRDMDRAALRRSFMSVQTPFADSQVQVKIGYLGEEIVSMKAEFDDCARISRERGIPLDQVADFAAQQARSRLEKKQSNDKT